VNTLYYDETSTEERKKYRFAGFWMRFWAYSLDLIVISSITSIILGLTGFQDIKIVFIHLDTIMIAIVTFLYFLLLTKKCGQTIGKRVLGLKVISKTEQPLTWSSLIFREVIGRYIVQAFSILYILYFIVAFQKQKQGLHDMIGDTYVVHEESLLCNK
jgi:uncharacterized RDD family membrane protein YckC